MDCLPILTKVSTCSAAQEQHGIRRGGLRHGAGRRPQPAAQVEGSGRSTGPRAWQCRHAITARSSGRQPRCLRGGGPHDRCQWPGGPWSHQRAAEAGCGVPAGPREWRAARFAQDPQRGDTQRYCDATRLRRPMRACTSGWPEPTHGRVVQHRTIDCELVLSVEPPCCSCRSPRQARRTRLRWAAAAASRPWSQH